MKKKQSKNKKTRTGLESTTFQFVRSTTNLQETRDKLSRINRPMMTNSLHIARIEMFRFSFFTS